MKNFKQDLIDLMEEYKEFKKFKSEYKEELYFLNELEKLIDKAPKRLESLMEKLNDQILIFADKVNQREEDYEIKGYSLLKSPVSQKFIDKQISDLKEEKENKYIELVIYGRSEDFEYFNQFAKDKDLTEVFVNESKEYKKAENYDVFIRSFMLNIEQANDVKDFFNKNGAKIVNGLFLHLNRATGMESFENDLNNYVGLGVPKIRISIPVGKFTIEDSINDKFKFELRKVIEKAEKKLPFTDLKDMETMRIYIDTIQAEKLNEVQQKTKKRSI